jgi:glycosyltransferase involved in cell wall biosynthesis
MKYSVITPHYKDLKGLNRLLKSLPRRNDIEVVIVDDNSDINTNVLSELVREYKGINARFYVNILGPKGAGTCRNLGLEKVLGQYILFADADDYFLSGAFDILDNVLLDDPNNDIYYFKPTSKCLLTDQLSDRHIDYVNLVDNYLNSGNNEIRYRYHVPWSKLYSAKFIKDNNCQFDEVLASNDVIFSLKTGFLAKKIQAFHHSVYCVTRGKGTLTVNRSRIIQVSRLLVLIRALEFIFKNNIQTSKNSVVDLIRYYFLALDLNLVTSIIKHYFKGNLSFFPGTYWTYAKNPKKLIKRITRKGKTKLSKNDSLYL